jgi:general secretion pathway protein L
MARIVGLDLGSYSIKVVQVEARGRSGDFEVVGYDELDVPPIPEGEASTLADRHKEALGLLKERGALRGDIFVTGLPGDKAAVRTLTFPFSDPRKIQQTLPFELEAEIPFDIEDLVISWSVLRTIKADDGDERTEVLVAYAKREAMVEHLEMLAGFGIDPRHVEFDALALDDLFDGVFRGFEMGEEGPARTPGGTFIEVGPDAPEPATAMVDIGHRRTSVCILEGERVVSAHTILHGGGDATRQLARDLSLTFDEAERGKKKEAFIEVLGARAQFPEQTRVSDVLKQSYGPIARRLRQIFQAALSSSRVRVVKVILTGGGSRVLNLDRHLSEALNLKVERAPEIAQLLGAALPLPEGADVPVGQAEAPQAGLALAYALSGLRGEKSRARIDFRAGDFAWKGELDFLRERAVPLGVWAVVLVVALSLSGAARAWVLGSEEDELRERQAQACETITGQKIDSASRCLAIIQERIGGQAGVTIPEYSAVDHYLELSTRLPPTGTLSRKVTELDINAERLRVQATVPDFDAVDKVVEGLTGGRCFESVEKGKARNVKDGVEFNVLVRLDCEKAPGEEDEATTADSEKSSRAAARRDKAEERRKRAQERAKQLAERRKKSFEEREQRKAAAGAGGGEEVAPPGKDGRDRDDVRERRLEELREKRDALKRAREGAPVRAGPAARSKLRGPIDVSGRGIAPMSRRPAPLGARPAPSGAGDEEASDDADEGEEE